MTKERRDMGDGYPLFIEAVKDIERLSAVDSLLDWDQETYMPPGGVSARAEHRSLIAGMIHERRVAPEFAKWLAELSDDDPDPVRATNIRETRRLHDRQQRIPVKLVKDIAHTGTIAKAAWAKARADSDFSQFQPHLVELIRLKRELAEHVGYEGEPYNALMDEFEPGARAETIAPLFAKLRTALVPLLDAIKSSKHQPDESILKRSFPVDEQKALCHEIAEAFGFDLKRGRIDISTHPFCMQVSRDDVRLTTRYDEHLMQSAMFGIMHEIGHGLYEQGLLREHDFTPMGKSISLGIHESQSRMWENMVGRSRPFWDRRYADLQKRFPGALADVSLDAFHAAINQVTPSCIRVEADEVTYNLHIVLRFEIERALFDGSLKVADIPSVWNEKMKSVVGIEPPNDRMGCLQDIHWTLGIFGYFPTYTLGNLYAAQFFETAHGDIDNFDEKIRSGDLGALLDWLRANIHQHGQRYRAGELCERVTGKPLAIEPFTNYLAAKFSDIYKL